MWKSCREPDEFTEKNAANLTAELDHSIRKAKGECDKINHDLLQWFGVPGAAAVTAGLTAFLPGTPALSAALATGAIGLIQSRMKRTNLKSKIPAAFFLTVKK